MVVNSILIVFDYIFSACVFIDIILLILVLDPELRFTRYIVHTANKALRKLSILKKLCGTTWRSRPKTVKNAFCSIIRPLLEYAAPLWNPSSQSSKIDSVQHRASKIIIGAVFSINNNKVNRNVAYLLSKTDATLPPSNLLIDFVVMIHVITTRVFNEWKGLTRLKRFSTLQLDKDIRSRINLEHSSLDFVQEPLFPQKTPSETKFGLNLLQPC
ncbi:reverse transcriptase domain-containing protein [Caerostris extrusa]|uniref:Reverse transcriptase domain-containing protein n=1 Tax=Caerostris extrusa TaxID=172846 RepID=A0AAV4WQ93_CAEEX|nr:reverse transcriptase domain-containing protein [Caerostris extrusa]